MPRITKLIRSKHEGLMAGINNLENFMYLITHVKVSISHAKFNEFDYFRIHYRKGTGEVIMVTGIKYADNDQKTKVVEYLPVKGKLPTVNETEAVKSD